MANGKEATDLTATELERRLVKRYNGEDFALCFGVRNDAGFAADGEADAIGVGLWPSRGCRVHGFEIKASRADWLKELKKPAKAEAFVPYCDYWLIVAGSRDMVKLDELPAGWGLLVPRGDALEMSVLPKLNDAVKPMPRGMFVAMVKRAQTQNPNKLVVAEAFQRGKDEGMKIGMRQADRAAEVEGNKRLREAVTRFHRETGINVEYSYDAPAIARAMALLQAGRSLKNTEVVLRHASRDLAATIKGLDELAARVGEDAKAEA